MLIKRFKKPLLAILIIAFTLILVYWNSIITFGFEQFLGRFSKTAFDGKLHYESIEYKDKTWILSKPRLVSAKTIAEGGVQFKADSLAIQVLPDIWNWRAEIQLGLQAPQFDVLQASTDFHKLILNALTPAGLFDIKALVDIHDGVIYLHDSDTAQKQSIYFQLGLHCAEEIQGCLTASLADPKLNSEHLRISLSNKEKRQFNLDFNFDKVDCASFNRVARTLFPELQLCNVTEGLLDGKMTLILPKTGQAYALGDLKIQNVHFQVPHMELEGIIQEALVHLAENSDPRLVENKLPRTIGHLELSKNSRIAFKREGELFCRLEDLTGTLYFQTLEGARLFFTGNCFHQGRVSTLDIVGETRFAEASAGSLDLSLRLYAPDREDALLRFLTRELGSKFKFAEISLSNIGPSEFDLLQALINPHLPETSQAHMTSGRIDATVLAYMKGLRVTDFKIEKLAAKDLELDLDPWELNVKVGHLSGSLAVNLAAVKVLDTLNADLVLSQGQVLLSGFNKDLCHLTDMQTLLVVRRGHVLPSIVQGEFAGLKGTIEIDGHAANGEVIKLNFKGGVQGLAGVLPENLLKTIQEEFKEDDLNVHAGVHHTVKGLRVAGYIKINGKDPDQVQQIDFGFDLEKTSQKLWGKWPVPSTASQYWGELGPEIIKNSIPAIGMPLAYSEGVWLKKEMGIAGLILRKGWFHTAHLPLSKYISPLLFTDRKVTLTGLGDFKGVFDQGEITLEYDLHDCTMQSTNWTLEIPRLLCVRAGEMPGRHYFDLSQGIAFGHLPLVDAIYIDKRSNLTYQGIQSTVISADKKFHFTHLKTRCCDLDFAGEILLDLTDPKPGFFDINIQIQDIQGVFSSLQRFYSHFEKLKFFQKFPLEAKLALGEKGAGLQMNFTPEDVKIASWVQGKVTAGRLLQDSTEMTLENLSFTYDYDQKLKTFEINDLHGDLKIGDADSKQDYILVGEKMSFGNCETGEVQFDLWLGDHQRDIVRIAGTTCLIPSDTAGNSLEFHLNPTLTHFGDVHPENFKFVLKDWTQVELFHVDFGLSLSTMLRDLQMLSRSGVLFLPKNLLSEVNALKNAEGQFKVSLDYKFNSSQLTYLAVADDVVVGNHQYRKCLLSGKKTGNTLAIDQLLLDDISIGADLTRLTNSWKVNFMGLRFGQFLLIGLEGDYRDGEKTFEAKVNLLEANFDHADEWPALHSFVASNKPSGTLRATGQLHLEALPESKRGWHADILLSGALRGWVLNGLRFQDAPNTSIHFVTDRGLTVRHLSTGLKNREGMAQALLNVEKINYDTSKEELQIEGMQFNIPSSQVHEVLGHLQLAYPDAFTEKIIALIAPLKENENLEGSLNFTRSGAATHFAVKLNDGMYKFNDQLHQLSKFVLSYDLKELKVITQYRFNDHHFWLLLKTAQPTFSSGHLYLADYHPEQQQPPSGQSALKVDWKLDPQAGFAIDRAHGYFAGMHVDLIQDPEIPLHSDAHYLSGAIQFIPSKTACLVSQKLADACQELRMGAGYAVRGHFRLAKKETSEEAGPLHFHGIMECSNFALKGFQFQSMTAEVNYTPRHLEIAHLKIADSAGTVQIEKAFLYQEPNDEWKMAIPKIEVANFKPSLLQEEGSDAPLVGKPLTIRQMEIANLTGKVADTATYTGKGTLQFSNAPKKNIQNTIFAIPAEILTLIGLDLTVLNPVSGSVLYDIKDGKFNLTKLKDVYSDGKHSKFNLSHKAPSHVDFAGNLNVQIRMKQYNLFFKLAELFTFNIQGNWTKPTYSINNTQNK